MGTIRADHEVEPSYYRGCMLHGNSARDVFWAEPIEPIAREMLPARVFADFATEEALIDYIDGELNA